ncbi:envelope-like protein [Trifolium medium]|uniref:Envelope-like protein n=1 Tax=Trifolium medium TaxID=97028 RepID=A0A392MAZ8_9FABA|nr:envelope-like protein [Trifolium medium]
MKTVCGLGVCYEKLVKEFLVNIPEDCDDPMSEDYIKVFVRGNCVEFSPSVINQFMGRGIEAEAEMELTVKYALLNKIAAVNWIPTSHSSDVATGLSSIILSQQPGILVSGDVASKRESPLSLDYRLLEGTHVADIATTFVKKPAGALTRKQMIADLKDVSKALGEKKFKLDRVIQALVLEEEAVAVENEEGQPEGTAIGDNVEEQLEDTDESPIV